MADKVAPFAAYTSADTPPPSDVLTLPNTALGDYQTFLPPDQEAVFRSWVQNNRIPFDPNDPKSDYDMRGYWVALQKGDPRTVRVLNKNDNRLHFDDYWKTPYHKSFSSESQWATPDTPWWNERDQLIDRFGRIVYDERAEAKKRKR